MNETDLNKLIDENQSIKILPSSEESLRSMGMDVDLDARSESWFKQLRATWKILKKSPAIQVHIETFFQSKPDPHRLALIFVIKCEDSKDCKPKSLPYFIIETLLKWSQFSGIAPDNSLKLPAFHIATQQRNQNFLILISKTYQLVTIKQIILPIVKDMIKQDNSKQASQIIIAMELFNDVPVEDLMFPLIIQDKSNLIDEYLTECPWQVKPLVLFLDKLLDKNFSILEYVQNYTEENKLSHVRYEKIHYKPLGKLVARLCNKYKIPIETCKNLSKNRTTGGLRFLIHQKYIENNVSSSMWDDLVKDSLKQNAESASEFIDMLIEYDRVEALKWASYLNIPENQLPLALKDISPNVETEENWDENVNSAQEFYKSCLTEDNIIMIDTGEKFYNLMISDLVKCNVVSIDCEWKPCFGATQCRVALIQVATMNTVYLIDTLILNNQQYSSFWYSFYKSFLDNAEIIKLGFGLEQDLKEIKSSVIGLGNIKVQGEGLLDLGILWKSLIHNGLALPGFSDNAGNSLSFLVQSCFGLPLEKSEQCSNWELRPLRNTQIMYAALDAFVLLQIYDYLQKLCSEQGINFEEISNNVMIESKKKCMKKSKVIDRFQTYLPVAPPMKSINEVKFFVEHKLGHLMPYLRYSGIDTTLIPSHMLWHDIINTAISEDRLILVDKLKLTPNNLNYPQSSILELGKDIITEQLFKIFNVFNIKLEQSKLFSFCINCNDSNIRKLNPSEVIEICNNFQIAASTQSQPVVRYDDYDYEDTGSNFLSDSDSDEELYQPIAKIYPKPFRTNKGVPIEIQNVTKLTNSQKPAILCDSCGILFWDEQNLFKATSETVFKMTNLKIW